MRRASAAALLLLAVVAGTTLAGCDFDPEPLTEEEYVAEADGVADDFIASANRVAKAISNVKGELGSVGDLVDTFAEEAEALAARIEEISPPAAVKRLHGELIEVLENFAGKAEQVAIALKAGDLLGGLPALTGLAADALDVGDRLDGIVAQIRERLGVPEGGGAGLSAPAPQAP